MTEHAAQSPRLDPACPGRPYCRHAIGQDRPDLHYDVLIRGGKIVNGTGNPWFEGDVAIRGDRIAAVGRLGEDVAGAAGHRRRGLVVAPGFVNMHSHSDMLLLRDGDAQSKVRDGVTTEILGEDTSAGPAQGEARPRRPRATTKRPRGPGRPSAATSTRSKPAGSR